MKYEFEYEVKYQDVDDTRLLRLNKLEEYLLDVAGRVADQLGFGIQYLLPQNLTWVLTHMNVEMSYLPTHTEHIIIETWIESNAHMLSTRDYRIYLLSADGSRRLIGASKSIWAVLELTRREIVNVFDQPAFVDCVDGERLPLARAARPMPLAEPTGIMPYTIRYSDLDYNRHCNSCQYLEIMLDAHRLDISHSAVRLDLNYVKEVGEGQSVEVAYLTDGQSIRYQMHDAEGKTNAFAMVSLIDKLSIE